MSLSTRLAISTFAIAGTLLVAACGSNDPTHPAASMSMPSTSANSVAHNDADVTFLQAMYPHHAQAVAMAELVASRTTNQAMLDLASAVQRAQGPEMNRMSALLKSFGQPAPAADSMGGMRMDGMMSPDQMTTLAGLSGPAFDKAWLTMMIDHHIGAIDMARTEQTQGVNPDAKQLADAIITAQQSEITHMQQMLR